jgi:8-oxo-dGTP pyrophosphatase MutT (NUDIX family)
MFIGGVSLVGESSITTALREVSEELGINTTTTSVQQQQQVPSSSSSSSQQEQTLQQCITPRLFQCIVCTSYNRCVVDVFGYTIPTKEIHSIVWQTDEVAWGAFVPYPIVEAAAQLSIHRLRQQNIWPGRYNNNNNLLNSTLSSSSSSLASLSLENTTNWSKTMIDNTSNEEEWNTWDFVPDGLLVWESWMYEQAMQRQQKIPLIHKNDKNDDPLERGKTK